MITIGMREDFLFKFETEFQFGNARLSSTVHRTVTHRRLRIKKPAHVPLYEELISPQRLLTLASGITGRPYDQRIVNRSSLQPYVLASFTTT